ncbi:TIGR03086 family metal-binding protein [Pseudonocardia pini]|uniref:TIGR03086 family metal-binding protein n=1 Tax=Pseudonocardia pini TaxID=2758030 RepID=UPI0015F0A014|nr:TIGR03086 family metal-binding protein [Pseudonocardia pini]
MTEISERYARHADALAATIAAVPEDRWSAASPCAGWTARDVVDHLVEVHGMFLGLVGRRPGPGPADPTGAFAHVRAIVQADLEDPERADAAYAGMFGTTTFARSVDGFVTLDLIVHRWDLGTAAGLDVEIPADEIDGILALVEQMPPQVREAGTVFGPALTPPEGADDQTRVLATIGRKGW